MYHLLITFLDAILVGIMVAAPIGPISMLCVRYTIYQGFISGFAVVLGAACGDLFYTSIIGFGLSEVSGYLIASSKYIKSIGGGFLMYLGVKALLSGIAGKDKLYTSNKNRSHVDSNIFIFFISFLTTIISPMTILLFLSMFTAVGVTSNNWIEGLVMVSGAFLGSVLWLTGVILIIFLFKQKLSNKFLKYINYLSGAILLGFGIFSTFSVLT